MRYNQNMTKLDRQRLPMILLLEFMGKTKGEVGHNKFYTYLRWLSQKIINRLPS
jgi:hypothetical protein